MPTVRIACDVNAAEEMELERLDGRGSEALPGGSPVSSGSASDVCGQQGAGLRATSSTGKSQQEDGQVPARQTLVTGYAEHRASLSEKKKYRRAIKIDLKLPEASTALAGVPRRKDFPEGEEGRQAWKASFNVYAGDFAYSHVGAETVKNRMGAVGMWGDYCEREGHGKFVEWQRKESGTLKKVVMPMRDPATGRIKVPDCECIAEYIMVMAIGDTQARPKGGTAAYRKAWHHAQQPVQLHMRAREHGRGAYADTPMRFVSIEKMKEALAQFFDKHLQGTEGATNPATRPIVKSLMKVLSFLMGRRRKVVPKAMRKKVLMLVLQMLDLKSPTEVAIATYMTKNLVHGRRAADEFLLDWADVEMVEVDGRGTMPSLREMTQEETSSHADGSMEEHNVPAAAAPIEAAVERASAAASGAAAQSEAAAAPTGAIAERASAAASGAVTQSEAAAAPSEAIAVAEPLTMVDLPVGKVISQAVARKRRCEEASASALEVEQRLKGAKIHRAVTKKDRVQRGDVKPLHCCKGCTGRIELLADGTLDLEKACPVHMMLYSKEQQARRMRVHVSKLRGPVFADFELLFDVPNGAILVAWDEEDAARLRLVVKPGVMVITRAQEQEGVAYVDPRPPCTESQDADVYEVEAVVDARKKGKGMEYLSKWKDYDASENTWEPASNVSNALIKDYHGESSATGSECAAASGDAAAPDSQPQECAAASGDAAAPGSQPQESIDAHTSDGAVSERSGAPSGTWFHVDGYAVRAWGEASKVTQRMRSLLTKTRKRARDAGIADDCIGDPKRYSSKSNRMGMATEHRGKVPFDYTMNEGDWATRTVAQGYQEEEAPFAETQINGTDVVLGGATMDDALAERIVERTKAAEVAELRERAAAAEAEAATLRAILGISNAAAEGSMDARITSALSMLQTGNPPRVPPMPAMERSHLSQ